MNTIKRGKKNNDIVLQLAKTWNKKLKECMDRRGFTSNKAFAQAFKEEYGTGNATDVGRWLHVGEHFGNNSTIGFPSYDTMKRIADFLGVTAHPMAVVVIHGLGGHFQMLDLAFLRGGGIKIGQ